MNFSASARRLSVFATLLSLGSCTVYAPMQPTISTVNQAGQVEIAAGMQPNGRTEASVVYSPLPHLLVSAAGTFRPNLGDSTFYATRQAEVGLGGYLPLGRGWQLTGLAGYGLATTRRAYVEEPFLWGARTLEEYRTRYGKVFGQASLTHEGLRGSVGVVYRLARIHFNQFDYKAFPYDSYAVPRTSMVRHEALLFGRRSLDAAGRWQVQATMGLSVATDEQQDTGEDQRVYRANHILLPTPTASLGFVFRPTLPGKK
jgi:hypothetical protein